MTSHTGSARRTLGDLKKSVELRPASGEDSWLSLARGGLGQVSHEMVGGGRWKSQNRENNLSPYVEEPLNSKVIKIFVPELRCRKCFSCSEIPMFYVIYIWTLYVHFTHIRIMGMVQGKRCEDIPLQGKQKILEQNMIYIYIYIYISDRQMRSHSKKLEHS